MEGSLHFSGLAGSALEAKVDRTDTPAWYCTRRANGYKRVWFSFSEAIKPSYLLKELALFYDESTDRRDALCSTSMHRTWSE